MADNSHQECLRVTRTQTFRYAVSQPGLYSSKLIILSITEYAAAFFLLADRVKDAANVLATQLKDIQLAVAVTRVYEGDDGPVLKQLLQDKVLPVAAQQGDRWLAHWAFDMIGRRDLAMRCLAGSLTDIIDVKLTPAQIQEASHFRNSDPALLFYYRQLRDLVVPPGQDPYPALEPAEEWDFVMRTVRTYMRAGCAALALTIGIASLLSRSLLPNTQLQLTSHSPHMALPTSQYLIRNTNKH